MSERVQHRRVFPGLGFLIDAAPLLILHSVALGLTLLLGGDRGDAQVQCIWLLFLLPAWYFNGSRLIARGASMAWPRRYVVAVAIALAMHAWLASVATVFDFGFNAYRGSWLLLSCIMVAIRYANLRPDEHAFAERTATQTGSKARGESPNSHAPLARMHNPSDVIAVAALVIFAVMAYRMPRSNDVPQFILQQQAMQADASFQPSTIGMSALGVDETMPRWKSHLWHVAPVVIADTAHLPVRGVIERWLPIPLAMTVLVCLATIVSDFCGRRVSLPIVVIAVVGPILFWHRSYNAFVYAFRITNNFALDKDLCLFLLIPILVWLAMRWVRGDVVAGWLGIALSPAVLKFHPMTPVYFVLLLPLMLGLTWRGKMPRLHPRYWRPRHRRLAALFVVAIAWFGMVVWIGDAQGFHRQIRQVIGMDLDVAAAEGRPLHYWVGHYASFPDVEAVSGWKMDTTAWTGGWLHLRVAIVTGCGLLLSAHVSLLVWGVGAWRGRRPDPQRWLAVASSLAVLWLIILGSPLVLTYRPHLLGGVERLHWFAFVPSLMAAASAIHFLIADRLSDRLVSVMLFLFVVYSGVTLHTGSVTLLSQVRGLNSLLDFEVDAQTDRLANYDRSSASRSLASDKPDWLRKNDRVLLLDNDGTSDYHLVRRGAYWSEPYGEAMALARRGDEFLRRRRYFYDLLDRRLAAEDQAALVKWLRDEGITVIVDRREGADVYLDFLKTSNDDDHVFRLR